MSTFNGIVSEFPDIRIDFFRHNVDVQPPLACFLSHVHSDHLAGLESLRSPFVYCLAATREILLRLERYPCRINYAKGLLEARQQTYKHLSKVLKPLPLETPTTIELRPGCEIQVTLFDANHCPGAVMFLIENDSKAILYTGDIRSEPWFVNTISRNPNLVEYTSGLKTLDKIYLDTSFTEDVPFQTKAQGIAELLRKVSKYPSDTVFHFQAWTYGYEDVWVALSKALKSQVHVDDYKLRIYGSLKSRPSEARFSSDVHLTPESPALTGHMCGNTPHQGCLTPNEDVRIHSCEKGTMCKVARRPSTVTIQPIIAHLPTGQHLAEVGVGGGGDDLQREAELDFLDQASLATLVNLVLSSDTLSTETIQALKEVLTQAISTGRNIPLDWDITSLDNHSAQEIVQMLAERLVNSKKAVAEDVAGQAELPKTIYFPYSRHSSYPELCHFVETFRPKDVWPCTANPTEWMRNGTSIASLFGHLCSGNEFDHDIIMHSFAERYALNNPHQQHDSQTTADSPPPSSSIGEVQAIHHDRTRGTSQSPNRRPDTATVKLVSPLMGTQDTIYVATEPEHHSQASRVSEPSPEDTFHDPYYGPESTPAPEAESQSQAREASSSAPEDYLTEPKTGSPNRMRSFCDISGSDEESGPSQAGESTGSTMSEEPSLARQEAYRLMVQNLTTDSWEPVPLISTSNEYTTMDQEL
ncbi:hypothetical protein CEP51_011537 [Fusarium floridanum]|uniref:Protein artemis n=1 Tax=Fusarium floridanum TaxID=1325733 RepID=A0A428RAF3_9HYPO|nr:hypothetical protein CEP51_011537 [Fusarium floridanum]